MSTNDDEVDQTARLNRQRLTIGQPPDGIKVRRILRQVSEACANSADRLLHPCDAMSFIRTTSWQKGTRLDPDKPRFRDLAFVSLSVVNCLEAVVLAPDWELRVLDCSNAGSVSMV